MWWAFSTTIDAVDEHRRAGAGRVLVRVGVGGAIPEVGGIEDRDVGAIALLAASRGRAAAGPRPSPRSSCGRPASSGSSCSLVHVMADDPRERAVEARMRHSLADDPVIGDAIAVGADQSQGRAHDLADVVLGDRGDQHPRRAVVLDQVIADAVDRVDGRAPRRVPRSSRRRAAAGAATPRSARNPRTGCGPNC